MVRGIRCDGATGPAAGRARQSRTRDVEAFSRTVWVPKWSEAFRSTIEDLTGCSQFTYLIAVTHLIGDTTAWSSDPVIQENLPGCEVGFLTLEKMWTEILEATTTTPASSEVGRLAQLLKAARLSQAAPDQPPEV